MKTLLLLLFPLACLGQPLSYKQAHALADSANVSDGYDRSDLGFWIGGYDSCFCVSSANVPIDEAIDLQHTRRKNWTIKAQVGHGGWMVWVSDTAWSISGTSYTDTRTGQEYGEQWWPSKQYSYGYALSYNGDGTWCNYGNGCRVPMVWHKDELPEGYYGFYQINPRPKPFDAIPAKGPGIIKPRA